MKIEDVHQNGEMVLDEKENIICQPDITYQDVLENEDFNEKTVIKPAVPKVF